MTKRKKRQHWKPIDFGNPRKRLLNWDDLRNLKGIALSRQHIYRLINTGRFPQPIHIGDARVAFLEEEIEAWIAERITKRDEVM